jgi:hypothetical protein
LKSKATKVSQLDCSHLSTLVVRHTYKTPGVRVSCPACGLATKPFPTLRDAVSSFWNIDRENRRFAYWKMTGRPDAQTAEFIGYWQDRRAQVRERAA